MPLNKDEWQEILKGRFLGDIEPEVSMKNHTSLEIGGNADIMLAPEDPLSLRNLMVILGNKGIPFLSIGRGTNILVRDKGLAGAVISLKAFRRIEALKEGNSYAELFVEAGVPLQMLVNFCKEKGYSGLEGLTGIPGTVGGAIKGNAGSYGCEIKDVLVSVAIMDSNSRLDRFKAEGLGFGYRRSEIADGDIILSANIKLKRDEKEKVAANTDKYFAEKKQKQPISEKSAGCVFKNPKDALAGLLIDEAGCKGMRIGGIEVSSVHANFFINKAGGTASDFINLMDEVASAVNKKFNILLEPEIRIVGKK